MDIKEPKPWFWSYILLLQITFADVNILNTTEIINIEVLALTGKRSPTIAAILPPHAPAQNLLSFVSSFCPSDII
jgi:hypothetical protein